MYIFRTTDGCLRGAPAGFDPEKPDFTALQDVVEVLVVGKVLEKQLRLVPKAKQERNDLLERARQEAKEAAAEKESLPAAPAKKRRR